MDLPVCRVLLPLLLTGCLRPALDQFTTHRVVPTALRAADVDRVCFTGASLGQALNSVTKRSPHRAMIIADTTAALCDEAKANEAERQALIARISGAPIPTVIDARERERRLRQRAALRFQQAWSHTEARWPTLGAACPTIRPKDELSLLVGFLSGTLAMLNDKASGSHNDVPLDTLSRIGRAATCVDSASWWGTPSAFTAGAWATVPGSGPEGVDPWKRLHDASTEGATSGVRLSWAITAVVAANAGRDAEVRAAIEQAAASFATEPADPAFVMFDTYAYNVLLHQSDLIWIEATGHRTLDFGTFPDVEEVSTPAGPDPFAEDDPFADPSPEEPQ